MNEDNRKRDAMVNDILCDFDFERVQAIMVLMGVKWYGLKGGLSATRLQWMKSSPCHARF